MTDKELLELAAKAAGLNYRIIGDDVCIQYLGAGYEWEEWNPLTDDGDALRLAVKLHIEPHFIEGGGVDAVRVNECGVESTLSCETGVDEYAATRRAIVRAAAEIGKAL